MVEVFKTNVETAVDAQSIVTMLLQHFPATRVNFDLQDCDRILRLEGRDFCAQTVMMLVGKNGFHCEILE